MPFERGTEAFVAGFSGEPRGVLVIKPDRDSFTGHLRATVDVLVVAAAQGQGIGRRLLGLGEEWARHRGMREVVLDVFAGDASAIAFYERCGYDVDHLRMTKPLP